MRAFRARASDDHPDAALQSGVMLEHLAKAFLVGLHPTLLLERNFDFPTLLLLAGVIATVVLNADAFSCPVCGLRLQGNDQLNEAGLDTFVELREATEADLEAYYSDLAASSWERGPDTD